MQAIPIGDMKHSGRQMKQDITMMQKKKKSSSKNNKARPQIDTMDLENS